jgi:hypothetical protein
VTIVNVTLLDPAGTVTLGGTVATSGLLLAKVTTTPAFGAVPVKVTVPMDGLPPTTEVGFKLTPATVGGVTVMFAV